MSAVKNSQTSRVFYTSEPIEQLRMWLDKGQHFDTQNCSFHVPPPAKQSMGDNGTYKVRIQCRSLNRVYRYTARIIVSEVGDTRTRIEIIFSMNWSVILGAIAGTIAAAGFFTFWLQVEPMISLAILLVWFVLIIKSIYEQHRLYLRIWEGLTDYLT